MSTEVKSFSVDISEEALIDLKQRLANTRWPEAETVDDWSQGAPLNYTKELCEYWQNDYDWRRWEKQLNSYPQFKTEIDGLNIHFLHIRSPHADALPLVMTHGWPGSIVEFHKVIEPLTNPTKFGGKAEDAFHLVCPSLPGYGFSDKPASIGWGVEQTGKAWGKLMARLGYDSYCAQGGDWGAMVTQNIALTETAHCIGIHTTMPIVAPDPDTMADLSPNEQAALEGLGYYSEWDSGYSKQQSTRPQSLAYGLADSPSGQAAWIVEKFWAWMDCGEEENQHPENILSKDELLDNIMMYWLTNSAGSSAQLYWESFSKPVMDEITIPTGCSLFPKEIFRSSKRWIEKRFTNLVYFNELPSGGHFAAFEQPDIFVNEVRACFSHQAFRK
jgi:pimeloyl-ACP methyl ester carboxylesterase